MKDLLAGRIKRKDKEVRGKRKPEKKPGRSWTRREFEPVEIVNRDDPALKRRKKKG